MRPIFTSHVPGLTTVELPEDAWVALGLDGWTFTDTYGIQREATYANVRYSTTRFEWDAIITADMGGVHEDISGGSGQTMVLALRHAANTLGDSLTIREEWTT